MLNNENFIRALLKLYKKNKADQKLGGFREAGMGDAFSLPQRFETFTFQRFSHPKSSFWSIFYSFFRSARIIASVGLN